MDATFAAVARAPEVYVRVDGPVRRALVRRFPYIVLFREYPEYIAILALSSAAGLADCYTCTKQHVSHIVAG